MYRRYFRVSFVCFGGGWFVLCLLFIVFEVDCVFSTLFVNLGSLDRSPGCRLVSLNLTRTFCPPKRHGCTSSFGYCKWSPLQTRGSLPLFLLQIPSSLSTRPSTFLLRTLYVSWVPTLGHLLTDPSPFEEPSPSTAKLFPR